MDWSEDLERPGRGRRGRGGRGGRGDRGDRATNPDEQTALLEGRLRDLREEIDRLEAELAEVGGSQQ